MQLSRDDFLLAAASSCRAGRLQYLVGAGASQAAGLPSWVALNHRLLGKFLDRHHEQLELQPNDLREISTVFVERFGRDAAVDIVREQWPGKETFSEILREALYKGRQWPPTTIHYELASVAAGNSRLWTFNYDDLLQRAISQLFHRKALTRVLTKAPNGSPEVTHLHGYLPLQVDAEYEDEATLVLSEQDYHRTAGGWPTAQLEELLVTRKDVDVLLVGLSLADPRLRSVLLHRRNQLKSGRAVPRVFALLTPLRCKNDSPLSTRLAHTFTQEHERASWTFWNIDVLYPENHELVPFYLRQIRLGRQATEWLKPGEDFLKTQSRRFSSLLQEKTQMEILKELQALLRFCCARFAAQRDEHVGIGAYVPWAGRLIQAFRAKASFGGAEVEPTSTSLLPEGETGRLELRVDDLDRPEGASGYSFVTGVDTEVTRDAARLYLNFGDAEKREKWESLRDFSSLLCIPIYGSAQWVPLGVMYLTSNQPTPFWSRLDTEDHEQLRVALRSCFRELMLYDV